MSRSERNRCSLELEKNWMGTIAKYFQQAGPILQEAEKRIPIPVFDKACVWLGDIRRDYKQNIGLLFLQR